MNMVPSVEVRFKTLRHHQHVVESWCTLMLNWSTRRQYALLFIDKLYLLLFPIISGHDLLIRNSNITHFFGQEQNAGGNDRVCFLRLPQNIVWEQEGGNFCENSERKHYPDGCMTDDECWWVSFYFTWCVLCKGLGLVWSVLDIWFCRLPHLHFRYDT